ncbi:MAG: MbtH family NRPS accessory protein [Dermatophilaceae bacterium]
MSDPRANTADPGAQFCVVVNEVGDYSVWGLGRNPPAGWRPQDFHGSRTECLDHIARRWAGPRPGPHAAEAAG